jgi:hypothetical protein
MGFTSNFELTNFIKGTEIAKLVEQLRSANSNISLRSIDLGVVAKDSFKLYRENIEFELQFLYRYGY